MKNLVKLLICYSYLNSSAFSYGMQGDLYQDIFSPETSEAWANHAPPRKKVPIEKTDVNKGQALFVLQTCSEDDKIAKYLIENIDLLDGSNNERKSCWIKCYNTWKRANDLLATLAVGLERIDCKDKMIKYQSDASNLVVDRIKEIYIARFSQYDSECISSNRPSAFHFEENHAKDQSATRRLYDAMTPIMNIMRQSNYTFAPVLPDVYFFMMATPDDIKIGEALYWQREADLLLFDVQTSLLLEMDPNIADAIQEALALRDESLLPPANVGSHMDHQIADATREELALRDKSLLPPANGGSHMDPQIADATREELALRDKSLLPPAKGKQYFDKILEDGGLLRKANAMLKECISDRKRPVSKAMAIVNKCKNLARIDCIKADEIDSMMQNSVEIFFDEFARRHFGQFLLTTTEPQISSSMIKDLKNDFASLREIMIAYVNFHSANVESVSKTLMSFEETINNARMTELAKIVQCIPPETMDQLMHINPDKFARLKSAKDDELVRVQDYVPVEMKWLMDLKSVSPLSAVPRCKIISKESMKHLTTLTPEILRKLQEMPAFMRELFMKTPIEFAEIVDCEIDVTHCIIKLLAESANLICKKDGDIKSYTEKCIQYILEVLKDSKKTELQYRAQVAIQSAAEIVMHNRLSGVFGGSYTTENVLDCLSDLINSSIQKTAIVDIMNEVLGASDVQKARAKITSEHFEIFSKKFGEKLAAELINHRSVNSQNENLYNKYVDELNATTKAYLLNNKAKLIEIARRLYGDASYAIQLISMISKVDDPYKVYGELDNDIKYLLEKSILKDYIGRIRNIPIKDAVLYL